MFVIQAPKGDFHGSQELDGRPMGEDAAALPGQGERSRPHWREWLTVSGGGIVDRPDGQSVAGFAA